MWKLGDSETAFEDSSRTFIFVVRTVSITYVIVHSDSGQYSHVTESSVLGLSRSVE
jgi:hypothetical protein